MRNDKQVNRIYQIVHDDRNGDFHNLATIYWDKDMAKNRVNDLSSVAAEEGISTLRLFELRIGKFGEFITNRKVYQLDYIDNDFQVTINL